MPTILQVLTSPNQLVNAQHVRASGNTASDHWLKFTSWTPWKDFTYAHLYSMYQDILEREGQPPFIGQMPLFPADIKIMSESSMDQHLAKYMVPAINWALSQSWPVLGLPQLNIAPGSWVDDSDWALVSEDDFSQYGEYLNRLPGDTKLSAKWTPELFYSTNAYARRQWSLPVCQVGSYAVWAGTRYGFIITDAHLVVLRITEEPVESGTASSKPHRHHQQAHGRNVSHNSDLSYMSSQFSAMSVADSSYDDVANRSVDYQPVEYAVINWDAHGEGVLTIKLALFCLSLMAARDGSIGTLYPHLNSWRNEGSNYVHNTTGKIKTRLSRTDRLSNPESPGSSSRRRTSGSETVQDSITVDVGNAPPGPPPFGFQSHHPPSMPGYAPYMPPIPGPPGYPPMAGPSDYDATVVEPPDHGATAPYESLAGEEEGYEVVEVAKWRSSYIFTDRRGHERKTRKDEWKRVSNGWMYKSRHHTYFTYGLN